ncbi:unnamed protein product [Moneuplotes crassus]|uniref:Uncharacterized protein n=1 Tax=Euplotes crassus TaxID=5936 RepID=A0AAD1XRN6_EUPCR|nr:unnamed protein product [Moneuplotes crassus]
MLKEEKKIIDKMNKSMDINTLNFIKSLKIMKTFMSLYNIDPKKLIECKKNLVQGASFTIIKIFDLELKHRKEIQKLTKILKPRKIETLVLEGKRNTLYKHHENPDISRITQLTPLVTKRVCISKLRLTKSQFSRIISSSRYSRTVEFAHCAIDSEDMKINEDLEFKTECMNFRGCEIEEASDWGNHPERVSSIIEGIAKSGLARSLKTLFLGACGLTKEQIQNFLETYSLVGVEASFQSSSNMSAIEHVIKTD